MNHNASPSPEITNARVTDPQIVLVTKHNATTQAEIHFLQIDSNGVLQITSGEQQYSIASSALPQISSEEEGWRSQARSAVT